MQNQEREVNKQMAAPNIGLIYCSVFEDEIALLANEATHIKARQCFDIGLHDRPKTMRENLQAAVEEMDARTDIEAIVLVYGLCGLGTAGLRAGRHKLVITRAHDCMTLFMGSKERYAQTQAASPDTYFYTPGWNRARRVPGPERLAALREELAKKYDADTVDFLVEAERELWAKHGRAVYLELGTASAATEAEYAKHCAEGLGWSFEHISGDRALMHDLLWGNWDEARFQTIEPGHCLQHSVDAAIFKSKTT